MSTVRKPLRSLLGTGVPSTGHDTVAQVKWADVAKKAPAAATAVAASVMHSNVWWWPECVSAPDFAKPQ